MKSATGIIAGVIGIVTLVLQAPSVQGWIGGLLVSHPNIAAVLGGLAAIAALLHVPTKSA